MTQSNPTGTASFERDFHHDFDFDDPEFGKRYDDVVADLVRNCPIARGNRDQGYWVLTSYDDVRRCAQDWRTFVSGQGVIPHRPPGMKFQIPTEMDPPGHTNLRRTLNPFFTAAAVADLEPAIRRLSNELIDQFIATGSCGFVTEFARPLPGLIFFSEILGLPTEDIEMVKSWVDAAIVGPPEGRGAGWANVLGYVDQYLRLRSDAEQRGDVIDAVLAFEDVDNPVDWEARMSTVSTLIFGGLETTANLLGGGMYHLVRHPEDQFRLVADASLQASATEEFLRVYASTFAEARTATADVTIREQTIRAGEMVLLGFGAACRDPQVIDDPDVTDIARESNRHVAFGLGPHRCLGSHLARLEISAAFDELLKRMNNIRLAPGAHPEFPTSWIHTAESLPIVFDAR